MLKKLVHFVDENNLIGMVDVSAAFCLGECTQGPNVAIDDQIINSCTFEAARDAILEKVKVPT